MAREAKETPAKADLFPVKLMKNYRPAGDFRIVDFDEGGKATERKPTGSPETDGAMATDEFAKVAKDTVIKLGMAEAKRLIDKQLAVRADDLPA